MFVIQVNMSWTYKQIVLLDTKVDHEIFFKKKTSVENFRNLCSLGTKLFYENAILMDSRQLDFWVLDF